MPNILLVPNVRFIIQPVVKISMFFEKSQRNANLTHQTTMISLSWYGISITTKCYNFFEDIDVEISCM